MNLKDRILFRLAQRLLSRNTEFIGRHAGESCYLFGNGASIKHYDLGKFNDRIGIGCNNLFFHKDFPSLDIRYYYTGHPFLYYPFWSNPYSNKFEKNVLGSLYRKKIILSQHVTYFMSLGDYISIRRPNIYYCHHFGQPFTGYSDTKIDGVFTAMESGLAGMLGMAIFMGFTDVTLVGCDYLCFPQGQGHFFETGVRPKTSWEKPVSKEFLSDARKHLDLRVLTLDDSHRGHILPHISYEAFSGNEPLYRENDELVSEKDLRGLSLSGMRYRVYE